MASRKLEVEIIGDSRSLERSFGRSASAASKFGSGLAKLGKVAALGVGAAFVGLGAALKVGFDELAEGQKVSAQTAAALKSTGGVANVTAKQVEELAGSLSKMTGIDDEAIQANENLLLTFKNVHNEVGKGNDVFNRATKASLDLSTAGFGSLDSAAKMLGKALNDPIKGLTAMGRAGVTFSEEQKKAIKALVESGHALEAQKMILKEVESQVGGSAKAFGETLPGQLAKARNAFEEMAGKVAEKFLPILTGALSFVNEHWGTIGAVFQKVADVIAGAFGVMGDVTGFFVEQLKEHPALAQAAAGAVAGLAGALALATAAQLALNAAILLNPYVAAAAAVAALTGAAITLYLTNDKVRERVNAAFADIRAKVMPIITTLRAAWNEWGNEFMSVVTTATNVVLTVWKTYIQNFLAPFKILISVLKGDWGDAWDEIKGTVTRTWNAIVTLFKGYVSIALTVARAVGAALVDGLVGSMKGIGGEVAEKMQKVWDALKTAVAAASGYGYMIGRAIVDGIKAGIASLWEGIKNWFLGQLQELWSAAKAILGISSPSKLFAKGIGEPIVQGIEKGIKDEMPQAQRTLLEELKATVEKAVAAVGDAYDSFASAFSGLADAALSAFDSAMSAWKPPAQLLLDKRALEQEKRSLREGILSAKDDVKAAQAELSQALAGGDPAEIAAARERQASALKAYHDAEYAQWRFQKERLAQQQQEKHDKDAARERIQFENQLARLQAHIDKQLQKEGLSHAERERIIREGNERVRALMEKHGVDAEFWGSAIGIGMAHGINKAISEVAKAARALARQIQKLLKLRSPAEEGPLADLDVWWDDLGPMLARSMVRGQKAVELAGKTIADSLGRGANDFKDFNTTKDATIDNIGALGREAQTVFPRIKETVANNMPAAAEALKPFLFGLRDLADGFRSVRFAAEGALDKVSEFVDFAGGGPSGPGGGGPRFQWNPFIPRGGSSFPSLSPSRSGAPVVNNNYFSFPQYVGNHQELQEAMQKAAGDYFRRNGTALLGY